MTNFLYRQKNAGKYYQYLLGNRMCICCSLIDDA